MPAPVPARMTIGALAPLALSLWWTCVELDPVPLGAGESATSDPARDPEPSSDRDGPDSTAAQPRIMLHRKRGAEVEPLHDGARVDGGDLVQVSYSAEGHRYGAILSLDDRGVVTLHHPTAGGPPGLQPFGDHPIAHAFELDREAAFERFVLVTAPTADAVPVILDAGTAVAATGPLARWLPLPLPAGYLQDSLTLEKDR